MSTSWRWSLLAALGLASSCASAGPEPSTAEEPGQDPSSPGGQPATQDPSARAARADTSADGAPTGRPSSSASAEAAGSSEADSPYAACKAAPKGMACIPGGTSVSGSDEGHATERPRHEVTVSTFYIDRHEVQNRDYERCEKAKACKKNRQILFGWGDFMGPDQPAIAVTWEHADAYCRWAGKRLPTEAEWEKVARGGAEGRSYPWGEEPATCQRAQIAGCKPDITRPVGSFAAGAYGVFDMAGNGYEWVNDWASACYRGCGGECGDDCFGLDPQGPCGGGPFCGWRKRKVLKGGSWYWPGDLARGAWRRMEVPKSGAHRLSFRCAASNPALSTWPPLALTDPPARPAVPKPPTKAQLETFHDLVEDDDIFKVPLCTEGGGAKLHCREAFSYVTSNESSRYLWLPYIHNVGGGYVGVGADQAYSFIAAARSQWAWLFDYDPAVVRLHYIIRAVVLDQPTPEGFLQAFTERQAAQTRQLIHRSLAEQPAERDATAEVLSQVRASVLPWYRAGLRPRPEAAGFGWLRDPKHYQYIRTLYQQRRIAIIKGNLLTDKAVPSIAASARRLGVPVRVFYVSNADDQWDITPQYAKNIAALPFDRRSVVLRTILPRWRSRHEGGDPWDYLVQGGIEEQRRIVLQGWKRTWWFAKDARRGDSPYLLTSGLPARTPTESAPETR